MIACILNPKSMSANKRNSGERVIDINNRIEIRNCAMSLQVTEDQLTKAIKEVGAMYNDVVNHLKAYRPAYFNRKSRYRPS